MDKIIEGNRRCPRCNSRLRVTDGEFVCFRHGVVDDFAID